MESTINLLICLITLAGCTKETEDNTFVIRGHDFPFTVHFPVYMGDKDEKTLYIPKDSFCSYTWESQKHKRGEHSEFEFKVMSGEIVPIMYIYGNIMAFFIANKNDSFSVDVTLNGSAYYSGTGSFHNVSKRY